MNKRCFKCGETKSIDEFYRHPRMADGHLNKCKDCTKEDVHKNYVKRREFYSRRNKERNATPEGKKALAQREKRRRQRHPEKYRTWYAVQDAVRRGKIAKLPCFYCGKTKVEAHHEDYSKPFDIVWVCFKCHREKFHGQIVTVDM